MKKCALWFFVLAANSIRFLFNEQSPPGFYVDEIAGAIQALCIQQTGSDFLGNTHPLFSHGLGGGYYTAPYLYGQIFWTAIFGNSIAGFRSFMALVTTLTVFFLYHWVKRRTQSERTALWATFFATISPWAFQFSRIAWDPPLAVLFLVAGLFFLEVEKKWSFILAGFLLALAAYAYPAARIQVAFLVLMLPHFSWKKKINLGLVVFLFLIPLFLHSMNDPFFSARAKGLAIWGGHEQNPFRDQSIFGLMFTFVKQLLSHFSFDFLLLQGDQNLRHSTQAFGMLSWPEYGMAFIGLCLGYRSPLFWMAVVGIFSGIAPAALTWESVPHALRSIGAWPFFCVLAAIGTERSLLLLLTWGRNLTFVFQGVLLVSGGLFYSLYLYDYFAEYPKRAYEWFRFNRTPLAQVYFFVRESNDGCEVAKRNRRVR